MGLESEEREGPLLESICKTKPDYSPSNTLFGSLIISTCMSFNFSGHHIIPSDILP